MLAHLLKTALTISLTSGLLTTLVGPAAAQLANSGEYSARYGWVVEAETYKLEEGHQFVVGNLPGVIFNDAGKGFLHNAAIECPIANDIRNGVSHSSGYCIVTDGDGDKAFLKWRCEGSPACKGAFEWTGGTGKYQGLEGDNTFRAYFITPTTGYSEWQGEWQLP